MMRNLIVRAVAAVLFFGAGLGAGFAATATAATHARPGNGSGAVIVCFGHSFLATGNGTWENNGSGLMTLDFPNYNTGSGTDGHGMILHDGGGVDGAC